MHVTCPQGDLSVISSLLPGGLHSPKCHQAKVMAAPARARVTSSAHCRKRMHTYPFVRSFGAVYAGGPRRPLKGLLMSVAMTFGDAFIQRPHNATFATATISAQSGFLGRLLCTFCHCVWLPLCLAAT
jgi:hypothetical protein